MKRLSALALMLATAAAPVADSPGAATPIDLQTTTPDGDVLIEVIGRSPVATEASYTLEVSSGAQSGNRSVQRGKARLVPGQRVGLLTVRLAGAARSDWSVSLRVETAGGSPYTIERTGTD